MTLPTRIALLNRYGTQTVAARWDRWASCRGMPTDDWHPFIRQGRKGANYQDPTVAPRAICAGCPVREECLQYAVDHNVTEGIWGGMTWQERKRHQFEEEKRSLSPEQAEARARLRGVEKAGNTVRQPLDKERQAKGIPQTWCTRNATSFHAGCKCGDCRAAHALKTAEWKKKQRAKREGAA